VETAVEARDTEIAISSWQEKAEQFGRPPPMAEFSMADPFRNAFRFIIHTDLAASDDWFFLAYGCGFAKLLGLAERPRMGKSMIQHLPHRYRYLFLWGCGEAVAAAAPVRFDGDVATLGGSELYRACFMPLRMGIDTMQAVYGSFNFLFRTTAELTERSPSASAGDGPALPELLL
jgi:hypothetical protein